MLLSSILPFSFLFFAAKAVDVDITMQITGISSMSEVDMVSVVTKVIALFLSPQQQQRIAEIRKVSWINRVGVFGLYLQICNSDSSMQHLLQNKLKNLYLLFVIPRFSTNVLWNINIRKTMASLKSIEHYLSDGKYSKVYWINFIDALLTKIGTRSI